MSSAPSTPPLRRALPVWLPKLLLAVGAPVLLFVGLELALRLSGYGYDTAYFIPDAPQPAGVYRSNPRYTERFFPASFGLKPVNFRIRQHKPAGTARVFVFGESAAMGVPEPAFSIAPQLAAALRSAYPTQTIEVYNLGITAINSHAILPIVRQALDFEPDLFVFYMGNNEVVGPFGPGSAITDTSPPLPLIRASLWLKSTRSGQLLEAVLAHLGRHASDSDHRDWRGMEMFAQKTVSADDPRLDAVYAHFTSNLDAMLDLAAGARVPAVVGTVAVNVRDCAPFASVHAPGTDLAAWQSAYDAGRRAAAAGETAAAVTAFNEAVDLSRDHADSHFQLARALTAQNEPVAARVHYLRALELDALRFRTDARLNEIIREVTSAHPGATLVDLSRQLGADAASLNQPAGRALFFEHVHLTFEGNAAIATLLTPAAGQALFPRQPIGQIPAPTQLAAAIGFTPVGRLYQLKAMDELITRPPFTGQSTYAADRTRALTTLKTLNARLTPDAVADAAGRVSAARLGDPASAFLAFHAAKLANDRDDFRRALELLDDYERLAPVCAESTVLRAFARARLGQTAEAIDLLRHLVDAEPYYPQTYPLLASLWAGTGARDTGLDAFATWTARMPDHRTVRLAYAYLLQQAGNITAAAEQWRAVLQIVPDDDRALLPLLQQLLATDAVDTALDLMLRAHTYNPRNAANNDRLVQIYQQRGDDAQALHFMRELMASGPVTPDLRQQADALARRLEATPATSP